MDFARRVRTKAQTNHKLVSLENTYPQNIQFYHLPPTRDISLQEFEDIAIERIKVFRILEQAAAKNLRHWAPEYKDSILEELNSQKLKNYVRLIQVSTLDEKKKESELLARERDYISHFVLRFAYCRTDELRRWFVTREMELFRLKYAVLSSAEVKKFLDQNSLNHVPLTEDQKNEIRDGLVDSTPTGSDKLEYFKVKFTDVLDLVRSRKCFLKEGFAYVSTSDFYSVVAAKHQENIESGLKRTLRKLPEIEDDERLSGFLKGINSSYTGKDYTLSDTAYVPIESLDQLSKKSFPLCARMCHETLRAKHHMKHDGRQQYGLFLKGIGVSLDDSLRFWREEFTKLMDSDKFEKSYVYNIKHNYGKAGSMTNYTPYSCLKVIALPSPNPQQCHGCPYKIFETQTLKTKLGGYGIGPAHVQEILNYSNKGHYQLACARYFEVTHDTHLEEGINHPNRYFEMSQKVMEKRAPTAATGPVRKSDKVSRKAGTDIVLQKKKFLADSMYDEELWNITQEAENHDLTQKQWDEDLDMSEINY
ncbi:DNA primase large subunit [Pseudolycoriella hygida]|uniref:DNA primase large subunit n=1 Tax=Pseudolycoriella hygida TaxID=35572 RepID=A0A9Q0MS34_9DIPT|nr:DNA primase large subunit [Pseudolycoriella hygida]